MAAHGRFPTAQIVKIHNSYLLIDCGEGSQFRMTRFEFKKSKIDYILISHLHGDHYFGLIGLLTSYHLNGRTRMLHIYGPTGLEEIISMQLEVGGKVKLNYPIEFHLTNASGENLLFETKSFSAYSIPLKHRIPTTGFIIREKEKRRKVIKEKILKLDLPPKSFHDLIEGKDIVDKDGRQFKNEELTTSPGAPKSYAFCSDTIFDLDLTAYLTDIDLLYHEATFDTALSNRAKETFHSTTTEAATVAAKAGVKKLLIGHFSSRYKKLKPLLDEVKSVFPSADLAIEGETFEV